MDPLRTLLGTQEVVEPQIQTPLKQQTQPTVTQQTPKPSTQQTHKPPTQQTPKQQTPKPPTQQPARTQPIPQPQTPIQQQQAQPLKQPVAPVTTGKRKAEEPEETQPEKKAREDGKDSKLMIPCNTCHQLIRRFEICVLCFMVVVRRKVKAHSAKCVGLGGILSHSFLRMCDFRVRGCHQGTNGVRQ